MATLTEHTMLNGLEENLRSAIEYAGGNIPDNTCVWMYPDIIRNQLTGGGDVNLIAGNGINIVKDEHGNYIISSNTTGGAAGSSSAENITVDAIDAPEYSGISTWPEGTVLQDLLEDLFYKVIPKIPSIVKGDIVITDANGRDQYAPDIESYIDSLRPNTPYLRLFLASQKDPVYISMEKLTGLGGNGVVDLSNYYTIGQIDKKFNEINEKIDSIEGVDLEDYYNKDQVSALVDVKIDEALSKFETPKVDLDNYYTKDEVDAKIDGIGYPSINPDNYYTKDEVNTKLDDYFTAIEVDMLVNSRIKDAIDGIETPEVDLDNYYTKEEVNNTIKESIKDIEIQHTPDSEPITVVEVVEKVITQENQIQQVEQTVQNQTEQITQVTEQIQQVENTIVQKVEGEAASVDEAHKSFESVFKN